MQSLNFDDGYQSFAINGDESRVIRFNPSDPNVIQRFQEAEDHIKESQDKIRNINLNPDGTPTDSSLEEAAEALKEFDSIVREQLNFIFNSDIYDTVFAGQSPLCIVGSQKIYLFEAFMNSVLPMIQKETEKYEKASKARINKYTKRYIK